MSPTAPSSSSSSPSSSSKRGSGKGTPRNKGIAVTAYKRWESDSKHAIVDPSRIPRAASSDNSGSSSSSSQIISDLLSAIPPAAAVSVVFHALNRTHSQHSMAGDLRPPDQQPPPSPAPDGQSSLQHISAFFSQLPATLASLFITTTPAPTASSSSTTPIPPLAQTQSQPHMSSVLEHYGREHHPSYLADAEGYCVTDEVGTMHIFTYT